MLLFGFPAVLFIGCTAWAQASSMNLHDGSDSESPEFKPSRPHHALRQGLSESSGKGVLSQRGLDDALTSMVVALRKRSDGAMTTVDRIRRLHAREDKDRGKGKDKPKPDHEPKTADGRRNKHKQEETHPSSSNATTQASPQDGRGAGEPGIGGSSGALRLQDQQASPRKENHPVPHEEQAGEEAAPDSSPESDDPEIEEADVQEADPDAGKCLPMIRSRAQS